MISAVDGTTLAWTSAVLDIAAGVLLAVPALRLSGHQRSLERLDRARPESGDLELLRRSMSVRGRTALASWSRRDHLMLWSGFVAFGLSSLLKVVALLLKS